jgi:hypothetical protein
LPREPLVISIVIKCKPPHPHTIIFRNRCEAKSQTQHITTYSQTINDEEMNSSRYLTKFPSEVPTSKRHLVLPIAQYRIPSLTRPPS